MTTPWTTDGGIHNIPLPISTGALWLCGKHYIAPRVEEVRAATGNSIVVCLTERHELQDRYDGYIEWLEHNQDAFAWWRPIHDLNAPSIDTAMSLFTDIARELNKGQSLVVHCAAGIGRAGTTAVGVLMILGMTEDESVAHVRAHRPMAGPEAGPQHDLIRELSARLSR